MKRQAVSCGEQLKPASIPAAQKPTITEKLAAYQRDFLAAAEASLQQAEAVAALSKSYADAEPLIGELDRVAQEKGAEEKAAAEAVAVRMAQMIGWVVLAMIGIVGVLALLIDRGL